MNRVLTKAIVGLIIFSGAFITLFSHWEPGGEEWYYWLFSRIFRDGGGFLILGRSPLYTLYLNFFSWLGYPNSVIVEDLVTTIIVTIAILILFKRSLGLWLALFAAVLWIPVFQDMFPTRILAMAFICIAVTVRMKKSDGYHFSISYALIAIAFMLRPTFIIFMFAFLVWDIYKTTKQEGIKALAASIRPKLADWPIVVIVALICWFLIMQSPHKWNNSWISDTRWFPIGEGNSLLWGNIVQDYNTAYILQKYGEFKGHDFYHTNQELFNGATNLKDAVSANPQFFIEQIGRNVEMLPLFLTSWAPVAIILIHPIPLDAYRYILLLLFIAMVIYGAFRFSNEESMKVFVVACVLLICVFTILKPVQHYLYIFIPLLIASASWYGNKIRYFLSSASANKTLNTIIWVGLVYLLFMISLQIILVATNRSIDFKHQLFYYAVLLVVVLIGIIGKYLDKEKKQSFFSQIGKIITPLLIIIFSIGAYSWMIISKDVLNDLRQGELRMMENRTYSMKASFNSIKPLIQNCKGIMTLEHQFIGAFMDVPTDIIYDVFEIPPFGKLDDPVYDGLRPNRIDCLLLSNNLMTNPGQSTNYGIRYEKYIKPYAERLTSLGAKVYDVPQFGHVIIYKKNGEIAGK